MVILTHLRRATDPWREIFETTRVCLNGAAPSSVSRAKGGNGVNGLADMLRMNGAGVFQRMRWCHGAGRNICARREVLA